MNRALYSILLFLALPFVPFKLIWRGIKQPDYLKHWGERFGFYRLAVTKPVIWLHCVSVGETRAAEPLVKALQAAYPNHQILMTHGTPTGRETSTQLFNNDLQRVYLPYDLPFAVNRFLSHFRPEIGLIMETELWFNLIAACKLRQIPILLLNARLSEKSATGYAKLGQLARQGLMSLSATAAQTGEDASRLKALGAGNVSVTGNLKFDAKAPAGAAEKGVQLRSMLGKKPVFLAASTRDGEEALILDAVKGLDLVTMIVPRHPQRFDEVANMLEQRNIPYIRKSALSEIGLQGANIQSNSPDSGPSVILGDTMGEMFMYYAACDFTLVGGSLLKFGGQNLIEAAMMGRPILIGEHTFNFEQASNDALATGAAIRVTDGADLRDKIVYLLNNEAKRVEMSQAALNFSEQFTGATARMLAIVKQFLH